MYPVQDPTDGTEYSREEARWTETAEVTIYSRDRWVHDVYSPRYAVAVKSRGYHVVAEARRFELKDEEEVDAAIRELCAALPGPIQDLRPFYLRLALPTELALQVAVGFHSEAGWVWDRVPEDPVTKIGVKPVHENDEWVRELAAEYYPETVTFEQFAEVFHREAVQAIYDGQRAVYHRAREAQRAAGFATAGDAAAWLYEGLDYVSHGRFAYLDDPAALADYDAVRETGCCGFADAEVVVGGRPAKIGCCYGH